MEGASRTLKDTLKVLGHVTKTALSEFLAGFVADGVDRILKNRASFHRHIPMCNQPHNPAYAQDWAVVCHSIDTGKKDENGVGIWCAVTGLRVCTICRQVYYDEVPPPAP